MTDWLKNPAQLFDVAGKVAVITGAFGAFGAFGALAAQVLAGAGCKLVLSAGKTAELAAVAGDCVALGAEVEQVNLRPWSGANCAAIVAAAIVAAAMARFGRVDILVVASGKNDVW